MGAELSTRVIATNRLVVVDVPMVLCQLDPEPPAGVVVSFGVLSDVDVHVLTSLPCVPVIGLHANL